MSINGNFDSPRTIFSACLTSIASGDKSITVSIHPPHTKMPKQFPRSELLSINQAGVKNYAVDPLKLMAWARDILYPFQDSV